MSFIVAIDGPAGTGKGTVTQKISKKLGLVCIDTGAMYRCVTLAVIQNKIVLEETEKIIDIAKKIKIELKNENGQTRVFLDEKEVTNEIRSNEVNALVSKVSAIIDVRKEMVNLQRKMAVGKNVIMEGRDIGTYVFPNADVKIYLDADVEERARRRVRQNKEKGIETSYEEVLENIRQRDEDSKHYEMGALKQAEDAIRIDGTRLSVEQVTKKIEEIIKEKQKETKLEEKIYQVRPETKWKILERKILKGFLHTVYRLLFRIEIIGEPLPEKGAYILCANHINYWDAVGLVTSCKRKVYFMAKEDLFKSRFLNWVAHIFDVIPIKRGKQDMEGMKRALSVLKKGEILGLFPEGTRKGIAKGAKVKNGAAYMALRTGTKVIPVGIQGNFKPFTKVKINYGRPLDFSNIAGKNAEKEELEKVSKEIMDNIIKLTNKEK